jgi:hypothetical protein
MLVAQLAYSIGQSPPHRVVCGDASDDEIEGPRLAVLVLGLELVAWEVGRCGGGANADVREQSVLGDIVLGLRTIKVTLG